MTTPIKLADVKSVSLPDAPLDLRQAAFETAAPGAIYAGNRLRNLGKKRTPSDYIFIKRPEGETLDEIIEAVISRAPGDWKTLALLAHEAGMDYGSARRLKWEQVGDYEIHWVSSGNSAGEFKAALTPLLKAHLAGLPRSCEFVCPTVALMAGAWARNEWRKACGQHLRDYYNPLRRFSIWPAVVERHDRLAQHGDRPPRVFKPGRRDLKAYVKARLKAIREGKVPTGAASGSPCFNQYRMLQVEELRTLASQLEGEWRLAVLVLFYLFISIGQLCRITWDRFDLENGMVDLPGRKGTPIHPVLLAFLRKWPGKKEGKLISYTGDVIMVPAALPVFQKAGIVDPRVRLTSIRRTCVFLLKQHGVVVNPKGKIVMSAGHGGVKPTAAEKLKRLRAALAKLPNILDGAG